MGSSLNFNYPDSPHLQRGMKFATKIAPLLNWNLWGRSTRKHVEIYNKEVVIKVAIYKTFDSDGHRGIDDKDKEQNARSQLHQDLALQGEGQTR